MDHVEKRDAVSATLDRYENRLTEIEQTMQGLPRPQILEALCAAAADVGPCVPVRTFEQWARRVSDGQPMIEPQAEDLQRL